MSVAGGVVQGSECRKDFEEKTKRCIDAWTRRLVSGKARRGLEQIVQSIAGDELRDDRQSVAGVAVNASNARKALVVERDRTRDAFAEEGLECPQLRAQVQPLEHDARFAIEFERTPAEAVLVPGSRNRDWKNRRWF